MNGPASTRVTHATGKSSTSWIAFDCWRISGTSIRYATMGFLKALGPSFSLPQNREACSIFFISAFGRVRCCRIATNIFQNRSRLLRNTTRASGGLMLWKLIAAVSRLMFGISMLVPSLAMSSA